MKIKLLALAAISLLLTIPALAEKPGYKKYTGQYVMRTDKGKSFTIILTRDGWTTISTGEDCFYPIAGKVKFWKQRQELRLYYPQYTFFGFANSLDNISGDWTDVTSTNVFSKATMVRTSEIDDPLFHIKFMRSTHREAKGDIFYNYGKILKPKDFQLAAYYVPEGGDTCYLKKIKKLTKLGFFHQKFPERFNRVDIYVIPKGQAVPVEYEAYKNGDTNTVNHLDIDGKSILAFNAVWPEYKQPKDVYK